MKTTLFDSRTQSISPSLLTLALAFLLVCALAPPAAFARVTQGGGAQTAARSPSDTVRDFYRLMREKRFREAFLISIYRPAIEGLSQQEFDELRPDFEALAVEAPAEVALSGEQISGDEATVFMKLGTDDAPKVVPVFLMRERGGGWLVGDRDSQKVVKKQGKKFFFEARISAHHDDAENLLKRISTAQLIYSAQHNGQYGDLDALIKAGLVPQDLQTTATTGYRFRVTPEQGGKAYSAAAEPARYGQTGRLSFYIDQTGAMKKEDKGGKPLKGI